MIVTRDFPNPKCRYQKRHNLITMWSATAKAMRSKSQVRLSPKANTRDRYVKKYRYNYADPLTKNNGRLMPFTSDHDGQTSEKADNCPKLDETTLENQELSTPGSSNLCPNLMSIDDKLREFTMASEQSAFKLQ